MESRTTDPVFVQRAQQRFRFMAHSLRMRREPPRTLRDYSSGNGLVLPLAQARRHNTVNVFIDIVPTDVPCPANMSGASSDGTVLSVPRVNIPQPPSLPSKLDGWVEGNVTDPQAKPTLRETKASIYDVDPATGARRAPLHRADCPQLEPVFRIWLTSWTAWAERVAGLTQVKKLHEQLFKARNRVDNSAESLEVVFAAGLLSWSTDKRSIQRHLFTVPAKLVLDEQTGSMKAVLLDPNACRVELDMLPFENVADTTVRQSAEQAVSSAEGTIVEEAAVQQLCQSIVYKLHHSGRWRPGEFDVPTITNEATITFSPTIIVRQRGSASIAEAFETIANAVEESGCVPSGMLPLVDPDYRPPATPNSTPGGVVTFDDEIYSALPLNSTQERILREVDRSAQVLVQGPPGTGKTHTAAALISHLLAQGSRILITAQTERALKEVRGKLPEDVRNLAVSILGSSANDKAELEAAIRQLSDRLGTHDEEAAKARVAQALTDIDTLREQRRQTIAQLVDARTAEVTSVNVGDAAGTPAVIVRDLLRGEQAHGWIRDYLDASVGDCPITSAQAKQWAAYLQTEQATPTTAWNCSVPQENPFPTPEAFRQTIIDYRTAQDALGGVTPSHPAAQIMQAVHTQHKPAARKLIEKIGNDRSGLLGSSSRWVVNGVRDVLQGHHAVWQSRASTIHNLVQNVEANLANLDPRIYVTYQGERGRLIALADNLRVELDKGKVIKCGLDGSPKYGFMAWYKEYAPFFTQVTVGGQPPVTLQAVATVQWWLRTDDILDELDRAWPADAEYSQEDTPHERAAWHRAQLSDLNAIATFSQQVQQADTAVASVGVGAVNWESPQLWDRLKEALRFEELTQVVDTRMRDIVLCRESLRSLAESSGSASVAALADAAIADNTQEYSTAYPAACGEWKRHILKQQVQDIRAKVSAQTPRLAENISLPDGLVSIEQVNSLFDSWTWAQALEHVLGAGTTDVNELQHTVNRLDDRIRQKVTEIATTRAWIHALAPTRLTGSKRSSLTLYTQQVRKLGKGTGKYANARRAEIRETLRGCADAVPVWIMPLYRVVEQFKMTPDLFDVIIVDEASQADLSATFLQYLAPKMVVIGDDLQVSPAAVGVDQTTLRSLADQYLQGDPHKSAWQEPTRSLFDEAGRVYGAPVTLTEHRRCVPEIIGFSNQIAYEPNGIRLVPVRQVGADRLAPFVVEHLPNGLSHGGPGKMTNSVEADAIVDRVLECLKNEEYEGKTFGVISLTGAAQATLIESRLMQAVPPSEWEARELRCGDSASFQGSERDVVFLSMVVAPEPGRRVAAQTRLDILQRYNVAVSRAKDQVQLFHSVALDGLSGQSEDMRFALLNYAYRAVEQHDAQEPCELVPHSERVEPFDSLFEQRVYNNLVSKGYNVTPQVDALGYRIDLVINGAHGKLAVECDGDAWHGPDAYERDLARQRNLERCGWVIHRVRESEFYADEASVMSALYDEADKHTGLLVEEQVDVVGEESGQEPQDALPESEPTARSSVVSETSGDDQEDMVDSPDDHATPPDVVHTQGAKLLVEESAPRGPQSDSTGMLRPYKSFNSVVDLSVFDEVERLVEVVINIVRMEGPVLAPRICDVVRQSTGLGRLRGDKRNAVMSAIDVAVSRGLIKRLGAVDDPEATFTVPGQQASPHRGLGQRTIGEVPLNELAGQFRLVPPSFGEPDERLRAVLTKYGRTRLTGPVRERLEKAMWKADNATP